MTKQRKPLTTATFDNDHMITPGRFLLLACIAVLALMSWNAYQPGGNAPARSTAKAVSPVTTSIGQDPSVVIQDLVQTHPHPEIRRDLNALILNHEIGLNFANIGNEVGALASVVYGRLEGSGKEALGLNFNLLDLLDTKISRAFKQLVIYHEWIHIKQQRTQRYPAWLAKGRPLSSPEEAGIFFNAEAEAYLGECRLAVQLKQTNEVRFCSVYMANGEPAMKKALGEYYASLPIFSPFKTKLLAVSQE